LRGGGGILGQPHHPSFRAAIEEELADGITQLRFGVQAAEVPLEVGEAEEVNGLVERASVGVTHERGDGGSDAGDGSRAVSNLRSEEHTSELQSLRQLVC